MTDSLTPDSHPINDRLGKLTLEEKVQLVTGRDLWSTWPLPSIGLRSMVLSDVPAGVHGPRWDERDPSLDLPSGSALSASWDPKRARAPRDTAQQRVGLRRRRRQ